MHKLLLSAALLCSLTLQSRAADQPWMRLPPTPTLPHADRAATVPVNGVQLWYAIYGTGHGSPVILLHGGLANSDYWGNQVPVLARNHQVIVLDTRGHGRSGRNYVPFSYDVMATDVMALMDVLFMPKAAVIGWSDGAITALDLAMHHPDRVSRVFAFAANSGPSGVKDIYQSPVFKAFVARASQEYARLSPTPQGYAALSADIGKMWANQPHFSAADLRAIKVPVWIVDGDHDEAIQRSNTDFMAATIPGAREMILPGVSHFAFLQDAAMFNYAVQEFLAGQ